MTLLKTKLHPPVMRAVVHRQRLFNKLDSTLDTRLTLVAAPAGFGKTTLVVEWLSQQKVPLAWLSIDENDQDTVRFIAYLTGALQTIEPLIGRSLTDLSDAKGAVTLLINDLAAVIDESHFLLAIDDYHLIDNPQIDDLLAFLLDHLPERVHLILMTRIDPLLPLARLRARRQITEIREQDLRFTDDETAFFLRNIGGFVLSDADIHRLRERTEGWIAGLQLAAMTMEKGEVTFADTIKGTQRYIMDYLMDEVFRRQPEDVQQFLLQTAVLRQMCAELCDHVRGSDDSQLFLERLERANLFIIPLDHERHWYRYHHLFGDLLRQRSRQKTDNFDLHRRASEWYTQVENDPDEAIYHAHVIKDYQRIAALIDQYGDSLWEQGAHDRLRRWLALLPADIPYPRLIIFRAWLAFTAGYYGEAESFLVSAEQYHPDRELRGRIAATRAFIATFQGDLSLTARYAEEALTLLDQSTWRASAAIALGDARALQGQSGAIDAYRDALVSSSANLYLALNAGFKLAGIQRQGGMLKQAHSTVTRLIEQAEQRGLAQTVMAGCLYALRGDILAEWNRIPEALAETQQGMESIGTAQHLGFAGWIHVYRARVLLVARQFDELEIVLDSMQNLSPLPVWLVSPLSAMRALLMLARGDFAGVGLWVQERGLSPDDPHLPRREFEYLVYARLLAVQGKLDAARTIFERLLESAHGGLRVTLLTVYTLVLLAQGERATALDTLTEALKLGEAGGYVRSFLEPPLLPLLKALPPTAYTAYVLTFHEHPVPENPADVLSEREREVLRLIADGLKNQEIANTLVISLNTVLYHTKNIYSKLHVTHRTQAVQKARELGVV